MKVLVTGGAGHVGSVLVPRLLDERFKVRVVDFLMFGGESLLGSYGNKNFEFINGDLRKNEVIDQSLKGIDAVVHLAALVGEEACNFNQAITKEINFEVTRKLVEACKKRKIGRFVFASTCSNYGIQLSGVADEKTRLNITSSYAETKVACEEYLNKAKDNHFYPCIYRLAMKFGLSPKMRFNLIVNDFAREAVLRNKVIVFGPESWRGFTHIQDAATAYVLALKSPLEKISGETFNVATENFQKKELISLIKKYLPKVKIETVEGKKDPRNYRVSIEKIIKVLGFRPTRTVEDGFLEIKDALEKKIFSDPYDPKYSIWYNANTLLKS